MSVDVASGGGGVTHTQLGTIREAQLPQDAQGYQSRKAFKSALEDATDILDGLPNDKRQRLMEFIINTTKAPADFCESTLKALAMPKAETKADIRNYELMVSELSSTYLELLDTGSVNSSNKPLVPQQPKPSHPNLNIVVPTLPAPAPLTVNPPSPKPIVQQQQQQQYFTMAPLGPSNAPRTLINVERTIYTVTQYVDDLKEASFNVVFQFAVTLYSSQPSALKDAEGDVRKYLFHISRHTAVISGVAKVPVDGVSAGIFLFRIGAHSESVPEVRFKTLVREYLGFLEQIEIKKIDMVIRFTAKDEVLRKLEFVEFPGGFTFAVIPEARDFSREVAANRRSYDGKDNTAQEDLLRATPAINVRELHRRQLCVACRHFLRGMCYRGDACNFCHDASHQQQLEQSSVNLRGALPRAVQGQKKKLY